MLVTAGRVGVQVSMGVAGRMPEAGRDDELALLWRDAYPGLVRLGFLVAGDRGLAEELAQEAFIRARRGWDRIRNEESAGAYLRATVVNLARNSVRRRILEARHRPVRDPRPVTHAALERLDFVRAVQALPPRQRACVALRYYEDLTEEVTARILGISVGTVKSQTHKALRRLQELLGEMGNR
ncbi:MAG: SigE family RNA polymerase sigma factor [Actinomycetota bacterium]